MTLQQLAELALPELRVSFDARNTYLKERPDAHLAERNRKLAAALAVLEEAACAVYWEPSDETSPNPDIHFQRLCATIPSIS
jgi:hypothetical protein